MKQFLSIIGALVGVVLMVYLGAMTRNTLQEYNYIGRDMRDLITISGQGKVTVTPDLTTVTLGVVTEGDEVEAVQTENTEKMNKVINMVKDLGIKKEDIRTLQFEVYPRYDWTDGERKEAGFEVRQNVEVKVRNQDDAGKVLSQAAMLGANQIGSPQFTVDDPTEYEQQARLEAIQDAQKKAKELAEEVGMKIVRVVSFSESGGGMPYYPTPMMARAEVAADASVPPPTIEAGTQEIVMDVSVTFEVR